MIFDTNESGIFYDSVATANTRLFDVSVFANASGQFGPTAINNINGDQITLEPDAALEGGGLDTLSGYAYASMRAPVGATVVSPVTGLLDSIDDDLVAANIGLGMSARELATFAAVPAMSDPAEAALGRRVTALNLKLAAFAFLNPTGSYGQADTAITFDGTLGAVVEQLKSRRVDWNGETDIRAILDRSSRMSTTSSDAKRAIASLLARYGAAVDAYLSTPQHATDIQHGLRLVVLPVIEDLARGGYPDTTDADAITTERLLAAFREFAEIPSPTIQDRGYVANVVPHSLVAVTDLRSISRTAAGNSLALSGGCQIGAGPTSSPACNDLGVYSIGGVGIDHRQLKVTAIRVPEKFSAQLSATLSSNGDIMLRRLNAAKGLAWFEYDVVEPGGVNATGRVYVRLGLSEY
ncbi:hypothetical protein KNJ79_02700 [Sphingopyxis indica]|uniref:hypothetical protein n=1 Tax=Sphingopyxis indica TaxID=436663 RepID=UPI002938FB7D|nr:hypothetical protein [Sphingopyxis indica]WOF43883.1 hypothetical protein KNJ79_02700 [Sphingopyxis indica]